jgi:hypothetical protein
VDMSISLNELGLRPSMIRCDMLLMWEVIYISNHNLYGSEICIFVILLHGVSTLILQSILVAIMVMNMN